VTKRAAAPTRRADGPTVVECPVHRASKSPAASITLWPIPTTGGSSFETTKSARSSSPCSRSGYSGSDGLVARTAYSRPTTTSSSQRPSPTSLRESSTSTGATHSGPTGTEKSAATSSRDAFAQFSSPLRVTHSTCTDTSPSIPCARARTRSRAVALEQPPGGPGPGRGAGVSRRGGRPQRFRIELAGSTAAAPGVHSRRPRDGRGLIGPLSRFD
jgi:hypothetical protein